MRCGACGTDNADVAVFCLRCGRNLRTQDPTSRGRGSSYALSSRESVLQPVLVSTVLPHAGRRIVETYQWVLGGALVVVAVVTVAGLVPAAILAAAFAVPIVYLVYLYDVNVWGDTPLAVVSAAFVLTGGVAALVSLVFFRWVFHGAFQQLALGTGIKPGLKSVPVGPFLLFTLLLPAAAEVVKNAGPLWLASRPRFDDMIDGLTFGIASGIAYAAAETVVAFLPALTGPLHTSQGLDRWLLIVLNLMIVKSMVYGTATGIAVASFSGKGEGYSGFTPSYFANLAFAMGMNVLYWMGVRLLGLAPFGEGLGLVWGVLVLTVLILRLRVFLHTALLEAALEDAAQGRVSAAASVGDAFCPECDLPLLPGAMFCVACGVSVRAAPAVARGRPRSAPGGAG